MGFKFDVGDKVKIKSGNWQYDGRKGIIVERRDINRSYDDRLKEYYLAKAVLGEVYQSPRPSKKGHSMRYFVKVDGIEKRAVFPEYCLRKIK